MNKKLGIDLPLTVRSLTKDDLVAIVRYIIKLSHDEGSIDDIDHLENSASPVGRRGCCRAVPS